ncbi:MAG: hypothetical protein H7273_12440 [Polaromonas sp.]|nr:hypothetical protein [Polaromonas sp.]
MRLPLPLPAVLRFVRFACQAPFKPPGCRGAHLSAVAVLAFTAATAQLAGAQIAPGTTGIDSSGNAGSEAAACMNGRTQQGQNTCLSEVRNANADKRAGKLGADANLSANALKRCEVFQKADDLAACRARVLGEQNAQGGVAGGGVLREAETALPASGPASPPVKP